MNKHFSKEDIYAVKEHMKKAHACNPSTLGGRGRWITRDREHPGQHGETPSLLKYKN